ncbi:DUF4135 domain-containing protein [Stappia stellulata]|uniref:DUF4135 domain-containing protein n=1 Tax=Stappia stellulata TaxID=71235 RepID=UPI00040A769B|nr:DUF4135 domain-containing protein [Stappia stellulata]
MIYRGCAEALPGFDVCHALAGQAVTEAVARAGGGPGPAIRLAGEARADLVREGARALAGIAVPDIVMAQAAGAGLPLAALAGHADFPAFQEAACQGGARSLGRHLAVFLEDWTAGVAAMLSRRCLDAARLEADFAIPETGAVERIAGACGEYHRGACVRRIDFEGGGRLAYKPRSVARERLWHGFAGFLAGQGAGSALFAPQTLERSGYGWCAWIDTAPATASGEVSAFYRHAGHLLFWLWVTNSRDAVASNLVARRGTPWLVDCETCVYPGADLSTPPLSRTGFLPPAGADPAMSRAGLSMTAARRHSVRHFHLDPVGRVALSRHEIVDEDLCNLPCLHGRCVPARGRGGEVVRGFREAGDDALRLREVLLARGAPFAGPGGEGRFVARATVLYGELMAGYLAGARAPGWLERTIAELPVSVALAPEVEAAVRRRESAELMRLSVPKFPFVDTADGPVIVEGGMSLSPLVCGHRVASARLAALREADLDALAGEIETALCPDA